MTHLIMFVMLPILSGLVLYVSKRWLPVFFAVLVPTYLFMLSFFYVMQPGNTELLVPLIDVPLPYGMALRLDRLSILMLMINNFLFMCTIIFAFRKEYMTRLFIFLFLSLEGFINGIFLSTDLFNVYILIEVATITVAILIMFKRDSQSMYDGLIYLLVNIVGMSFFLFGIGYLYKLFGVLDFEHIRLGIEQLDNPKSLYLPFAFLFTGICLKSAIMPLYSWLPRAHATTSAPSVVSAILSGIFVKVGIYLLIRMQGIFSSAIDMNTPLMFLGFLTAITGFIFAMSQNDIKLILAYSTISQIGLILIGISGPYTYNPSGGVYHILAHAVFKSLLFLIGGILVHHYNTRNINKMHDLWHSSKTLSITLIFAILSITGAPLFSGGYSKYFISSGYSSTLLSVLFWIMNAGTMASFIRFFTLIFKKSSHPAIPLRLFPNELGVLVLMSSACLVLGCGGNLVMEHVIARKLSYSPLSPLSQLSKLLYYILTYLFAIAVFHFIVKKSKWVKKIRSFDLSFNNIIITIVCFFFLTLVYLQFYNTVSF
ncbi:MAG: proton-conducting transporter membrane subunit [Proteocatella sp.]